MKELIKVVNGEVQIDSRMIAEHFGKEHKHVIRDIKDEISKLENAGLEHQSIFGLISFEDSYGRKQPCYIMGEEGALQLAARYDAVSRRKLIIKIKKLKENVTPQIDSKFLYQIAQQLEEKEREIRLLKPKAESYDVLLTADNCQDMGQVAKAFGVGRNKLFEVLRKHKVIMKKPSTLPYQRFIDDGYFEVIEVNKSQGEFVGNFTKTMVTAKGIDYVGKVLREKENICFIREVV